MANKNLNAAKEAKKDKFYTQLADIEISSAKTISCTVPTILVLFNYFD